MIFEKATADHVEAAARLALREYADACERFPSLLRADGGDALRSLLSELFNTPTAMVALENGEMLGYLGFFGPWDGFHGDVKGVFSPLGGSAFFGGDRGRLASRLFEQVGAYLLPDGVCQYAIARFADDPEIDRALVLNGFGIRCADATMRLSERCAPRPVDSRFSFGLMTEAEKPAVRRLSLALAQHLAAAPTFFPTPWEHWQNWYEADDRRVFVARDDGEVVGFMGLDGEAENYITEQPDMLNLSSTFVDARYRGMGVAQALLEHICTVCEREGVHYLGVDCETMNPTAARFWGKAFRNYTYSYIRRLDERVVGISDWLAKQA